MKPSFEFTEEQYFDYYPIKEIKDYKIEDDEGNIFYINPTKIFDYATYDLDNYAKDNKLWGKTKTNKNHHLRFYDIFKTGRNHYCLLRTTSKYLTINLEGSKMFEKLVKEGLIMEYEKRVINKIKFNFDKDDQQIKNLIFNSKLFNDNTLCGNTNLTYMYNLDSGNYNFRTNKKYPTTFSMDKYDIIKDIIEKYNSSIDVKFSTKMKLYRFNKNIDEKNFYCTSHNSTGFMLKKYWDTNILTSDHYYLSVKIDGDYYTFYSDFSKDEIKEKLGINIEVKKNSEKEFNFMEIDNSNNLTITHKNMYIQKYNLPNNKLLIFQEDYDNIKKNLNKENDWVSI